MDRTSNRGGEGRNTSRHAEDRRGPAKDQRELPDKPSQGIAPDQRGEDQPADKSRAQRTETSATAQSGSTPGSEGWKAQRDAARQEPEGPGEPAGHE
jgi:hypothetical protein